MTSVAVILPAYNEGSGMAPSLTALAEYLALHRGGYDFRYVIVDDGSTDDTFEIAKNFGRWRPNVRVLKHERNRGVGAALRTAFEHLDTDLAVVLDLDLSYAPATAMELIEALDREGADIALASPYLHGGSVVNVPFARRVLSREANRLLSLAAAGRCATLTSMVRAFRVKALRKLDFRYDGKPAIAEMLLIALRKQLRIVELPAALHWSHERRSACRRVAASGTALQIWQTLGLALRHRPALWLALPGLIPGLLPVVVAALLVLHAGARSLELGAIVTLFVQYVSLALFAGQMTTFFVRTSHRKRILLSKGASENDYSVPHRIA